jgi:ABC-type protease/lipase transport system fused ATPase/permease subunit
MALEGAALAAWRAGVRPTIVVIAHRPESLAYCERVIRLKDGRLSPVGD